MWVFSRVYFCPGPKGSPFEGKPGFDLGDGHSRNPVPGQRVERVDYDPALGMTIRFTDYEAFLPAQALKVSWKRPTSSPV